MKTMKRLLVVGCTTIMLLTGATQKISSAQTQDLVTALRTELRFDREWSRYLLPKVGCPLVQDGSAVKAITSGDCTLSPYVDAGSFYRARELAKKVFTLRD